MKCMLKMFSTPKIIVLLVVLVPTSVVSFTHYIKQHPSDPCPLNYDDCTTLSDAVLMSDNISLILSPGLHCLDHNLTITDATAFIMSSTRYSNDANATTTLKCQLSVRISLSPVQYVCISGLDLSGCVEILIRASLLFKWTK